MIYELILTDEATLDIEEAFLWYKNIEAGLAYNFETELYDIFMDIHLSPDSFQTRYREVKIKFLKRFPYGVHYLLKNNRITVVGVFHTSRNPKNWFKRIK